MAVSQLNGGNGGRTSLLAVIIKIPLNIKLHNNQYIKPIFIKVKYKPPIINIGWMLQ